MGMLICFQRLRSLRNPRDFIQTASTMVRVNLVNPEKLSDQHLIAEYNEILMLASYIKRYPELKNVPERYCLGKGHMTFFKDKLSYLKRRHENLKVEMRRRGFRAAKSVNLSFFSRANKGEWKPREDDVDIITKRIISKLLLKPSYYRYCGERKRVDFFVGLLK